MNFVRTIIAAATVSAAVLLLVTTAFAVPPGKTLTYPDGDSGKVLFSGTIHAEAGNTCIDCHISIFSIKRGREDGNSNIPKERIRFEEHVSGELCGVCHNGDKVFGFGDENSCGRCHKK